MRPKRDLSLSSNRPFEMSSGLSFNAKWENLYEDRERTEAQKERNSIGMEKEKEKKEKILEY